MNSTFYCTLIYTYREKKRNQFTGEVLFTKINRKKNYVELESDSSGGIDPSLRDFARLPPAPSWISPACFFRHFVRLKTNEKNRLFFFLYQIPILKPNFHLRFTHCQLRRQS